MQNFRFIGTMVSEFRFFKKKKKKKKMKKKKIEEHGQFDKIMFTCISDLI